jgi:nucleotide-binding universal stress UspA family protein
METGNKDAQHDKVVLIPTDFSPVCGNAIHHGVELANTLKCKVYILHVINKETKSYLKKEGLPVEQVNINLNAYKEKYEKTTGVEIATLVREGSIFEEIDAVAEEIGATMMILGTHGKKGLQHIFGSYALRVVLDSPCPVVVVQKRSFGKGYHKIVFPVTNDLEVRQQVEWALMMSKLFHSKFSLFIAKEKDPDLNKRLQVITHQITSVFDEKKMEYSFDTAGKPGDFGKQLISFSVEREADLIMIMTVPQNNMPGFSVSGWDEPIMFNTSQIPVMCINPTVIGRYYHEWITLI